MKKTRYHKILVANLVCTSIFGTIFLPIRQIKAETISSQLTLNMPAEKKTLTLAGTTYGSQGRKVKAAASRKGKINKKTYLYDGQGHKLKKPALKKGKKIKIINKIKIRGKKYYMLRAGSFVPANRIKMQNVGIPKKATESAKQSQQQASTDFSLKEFRKAFLQELNKERNKRDLAPVSENLHYDAVTQKRTKLLPTNFSHVDKAGNFILKDYFKKAGISITSISECIAEFPWGWTVDHKTKELVSATTSSSALVAENMIYEYIYNDADSNWGHRDILLKPQNKTIGVGAVNSNGQVYSSISVTP